MHFVLSARYRRFIEAEIRRALAVAAQDAVDRADPKGTHLGVPAHEYDASAQGTICILLDDTKTDEPIAKGVSIIGPRLLAGSRRPRSHRMIDSTHDTAQAQPVRVIKFYAENVMNLRVAEFEADPHVNIISGPNGSGKSSLVNSIMYALGGAKLHPKHMIRRGTERMAVRLGLGNIDIEMTAMRTANGEGDTDLRLEAQSGAVLKKPQHILDAITGDLGWEPIRFMGLDPKAQMEVLRKLVQATIDIDLDAIDGQILVAMEERRLHRPTILPLQDRELRLRPVIDPEMDVTPIDTKPILDELERVSAANATLRQERQRREDEALHARNRRVEAAELLEQARRLVEQAESFERHAVAIERELASLPTLGEFADVSEIRARHAALEATKKARDEQARIREEYSTAFYAKKLAEDKEEQLTAQIEQLRRDKRAAIARTKMPIEGLSFDEDCVTFNDLPLSQASQAEQWRVVLAIGMAMNPRLRIIVIREGSLLDSTSLRIVSEMAETFDYQVWIEVVDESGTLGVSMREGEVVAIHGVPVERRPQLVTA